MTEKEKCARGILYNANFDEELLIERDECKILCDEFNKTAYQNIEKRREIIRELTKTKTENFLIEPPFWCDYGYNIAFGENLYVNHNLLILDGAKVTFGNNVFIGPNCSFYTAGHPLKVKERNEGLEFAKPISVGNNVWFGGNVVVLPGVTIGDNAVIGSGSVVTKDIAANVLAVGNPCIVVRDISENL